MKRYLMFLMSVVAQGCNSEEVITTTQHNNPPLNMKLYDSVQTFVDTNIRYGLESKYYLVELLEQNTDSIEFVLTTIAEGALNKKYGNSPYYFNKDSSVLVIRNGSEALYDNLKLLKELKGVRITSEENAVIFNPLTWKISVIGDSIILDRYYGQREAQKNVLTPKERFVPPN